MLCGSGDRGCCGERPKWREARAEARAVRSVVGRESLRECIRQPGERALKVLRASGERRVVRETEVEARAAARAMGPLVGREA